MLRMTSVILFVSVAACGKSATSPTQILPASVGFGRIDASVGLDSNAQILAEDYDSSSTALYKALAGSGSNTLFSAYSVDTAMGMMYAGAAGSTIPDIANALMWRLAPADLEQAHSTLTTVIATSAANSNSTLQTGTRIWTQNGLAVSSSYNAGLEEYYGAGAQSVDFTDSTSASQLIDAWVAAQTDNLIPNLLSPSDVKDAALVQTAAMHFKADWAAPFVLDTSATTPFTTMPGSTEAIAMLRNTDTYAYAETATYQAVDIPYRGGALAFLVVLPKGNLSDFEAALTGPFVHTVASSLTRTYVQLAIPPLQLDLRPDLTKALQAMGMHVAFSNDADFSGTGVDGLSIQSVIGEAVLKLDAQGTEAAAATAVVAVGNAASTGPNSPPVVFTADHPFFFAIHDTQSNVPLFSGRIGAP